MFRYRSVVWRLEQRLLLTVISTYFRRESPHLLDFACGTGRILSFLASRCRSAVGLDVSESMLEVARRSCNGAEFIRADITTEDVLGRREFDLITAFRFFPNAEHDLRESALGTLIRHLSPQGILLFNNHKRSGSLRRRIVSIKGWALNRNNRPPAQRTMSDHDVRSLVDGAGLRIEKVYHLAVLPFPDHATFLPQRALLAIERVLSSVSVTRPMAQNMVYVCRHKD